MYFENNSKVNALHTFQRSYSLLSPDIFASIFINFKLTACSHYVEYVSSSVWEKKQYFEKNSEANAIHTFQLSYSLFSANDFLSCLRDEGVASEVGNTLRAKELKVKQEMLITCFNTKIYKPLLVHCIFLLPAK